MKDCKCILLVDDDPITNFIDYTLLRKLKITKEISIERNGEEALAFLCQYFVKNSRLPEVIIIDIAMPVMDGISFIEEYDRLYSSIKSDTAIIYLSTQYRSVDIEILNQKGYLNRLDKPLRQDNLINILKENFKLAYK